jgi:hypothetical protein
MKFTLHAAAALLATSVSAVPVEKRQNIDATVLQFALTLEHLEATFYNDALKAMPESDFLTAGYSAAYYDNLKYIAFDEQQHVSLLTSALTAAGAMPVARCTYKFPYTDVKSFVGLAAILEGVGSSAYLGAAPLITSKEYLGVAGAILGVEQVHTTVQRLAQKEIGPANPYLTAIDPTSAFTLAAAFIVECPSTNMDLGFTAFPALTATQGLPTAIGIPFTFTTVKPVPAGSFITFVNGLTTESMETSMAADGQLSVMIPYTASGQAYAFVTSANVTSITDSTVLAGPAVIEVTPSAPAIDLSYS